VRNGHRLCTCASHARTASWRVPSRPGRTPDPRPHTRQTCCRSGHLWCPTSPSPRSWPPRPGRRRRITIKVELWDSAVFQRVFPQSSTPSH
ncbi:hypothetical protein TSOC_015419, partial [Tetrabaena socialis]